jgi:hypothetical protein
VYTSIAEEISYSTLLTLRHFEKVSIRKSLKIPKG